MAEQLGLAGTKGVVITSVKANSPAALAGLASGMVVTQVNRQAVSSVDQLMAAVKSADLEQGILLRIILELSGPPMLPGKGGASLLLPAGRGNQDFDAISELPHRLVNDRLAWGIGTEVAILSGTRFR